jgi:hypothetical protein
MRKPLSGVVRRVAGVAAGYISVEAGYLDGSSRRTIEYCSKRVVGWIFPLPFFTCARQTFWRIEEIVEMSARKPVRLGRESDYVLALSNLKDKKRKVKLYVTILRPEK